MAEVIKAYTPIEKISLGGRFMVTCEVECGTEYKTGGFVISPTECGLPDGIVNGGWANVISKSEVTAPASVVIEGKPTEVQTVKLQLGVLGTATAGKPFKEPAGKNGELKEQKVLVTLIGQ